MTAWVALHGFSGAGADWALHRPGWPLRCPDLPGHGRGPRLAGAGWEMASVVRWLDASWRPSGSWVLCGYSMGGRVALHWALRRPPGLVGLVLIGAHPGLAEPEAAERRAADHALAARLEAEGAEAFARQWEASPLIATQSAVPEPFGSAQRARRRAADPAGLAGALRGYGTGAMPAVWAALPALALPTLLVTGEADAKFSLIAEHMRRALPDAAHAVLPGVGHAAHLEAPAAFRAAVRAWAAAHHLGGAPDPSRGRRRR